MRVYKLYGTTAADANALSQLIIQRRGKIACIKWAVALDSVTDNSAAYLELSFASIAQDTTNDTVGPIDQVSSWVNFTTSGQAMGGINCQTNGLEIDVVPGDRLYLNVNLTGTMQVVAAVFIYVDE